MLNTRQWLGWSIILLLWGHTPQALPEEPQRDRSATDLITRQGRHVRVTTDLQSAEVIDSLVASFDAAVPQWAGFLQLPDDQLQDFQVDACVIRDVARFRRDGLIPSEVPNFPFGYTLNQRVWVRQQPSEYYTRHLLLHEGIHALAYFAFQDTGPTWFQEGLAEVLATHRGTGTEIEVPWIPDHREAVPYWGRFKRMQQSRQEGTVPSLDRVLQFRPDLRGDVETYAWSWAAVTMLRSNPQYHDALRQAARDGTLAPRRFNRRLQTNLGTPWPVLVAQWRVIAHELDYGYEPSRHPLDISVEDPIWDGRAIRQTIQSNRGWQSVGVRIPAGVRLKIAARGTVTLNETTRPWTSTPDGITVQYHRGHPLGQLLACTLPNVTDMQHETTLPLDVKPIGSSGTLDVPKYSWLMLRVNDAAGALQNNHGELEILVQAVPTAAE